MRTALTEVFSLLDVKPINWTRNMLRHAERPHLRYILAAQNPLEICAITFDFDGNIEIIMDEVHQDEETSVGRIILPRHRQR